MIVSIIGSTTALPHHIVMARELGIELAKNINVDYVVCGGMGGIMEAICEGVQIGIREGFACQTIGILPGNDKSAGNQYIDISIVTGMGFARNIVVALTGDVVIAVGGAYGTLSELGHALSEGRPTISLDSWDLTTTGEGEVVSEKSMFTRVSSVADTITALNDVVNKLNHKDDI